MKLATCSMVIALARIEALKDQTMVVVADVFAGTTVTMADPTHKAHNTKPSRRPSKPVNAILKSRVSILHLCINEQVLCAKSF